VLPADGGATCVEVGGRCWELQEWMPGRADYREAPSAAKLRAAARAVARVHSSWEALAEPAPSLIPSVQRRLQVATSPVAVIAPERLRHPLLGPLAARAVALLGAWLPRVPGMLAGWEERRCRLQPCLRDVWHDHLLYEGETLTGLIDYAAVRPDAVATDLARLVGSLAGDDEEAWRIALAAYREVRALTDKEAALARALDRTGAIVALATWARWLAERTFEDEAAAERRLRELVRRVEGWERPT
jgi:Ser/Thr protein kinase RdoA (MazF antagonist)